MKGPALKRRDEGTQSPMGSLHSTGIACAVPNFLRVRASLTYLAGTGYFVTPHQNCPCCFNGLKKNLFFFSWRPSLLGCQFCLGKRLALPHRNRSHAEDFSTGYSYKAGRELKSRGEIKRKKEKKRNEKT